MGVKLRKNWEKRERVLADQGDGISLTKQSFKKETDINYILEKYGKTGVLEQTKKQPLYGDFADPVDYQAALNVGARAKEQFEGLSAEIRKRFANDPHEFLKFTADEKNLEEMYKLKLAVRPKKEVLPPVPDAVIPPKA